MMDHFWISAKDKSLYKTEKNGADFKSAAAIVLGTIAAFLIMLGTFIFVLWLPYKHSQIVDGFFRQIGSFVWVSNIPALVGVAGTAFPAYLFVLNLRNHFLERPYRQMVEESRRACREICPLGQYTKKSKS